MNETISPPKQLTKIKSHDNNHPFIPALLGNRRYNHRDSVLDTRYGIPRYYHHPSHPWVIIRLTIPDFTDMGIKSLRDFEIVKKNNKFATAI